MFLVLDDSNSQNINSVSDLTNNNLSKTILYFTASWCGPCKAISPTVEALSQDERFSGSVLVIKIDVDQFEDISADCDVSCMPTFQLYQNQKLVNKVEGADAQKLTQLFSQ
tara:strand:+ start:62 stop:394 length:333 start_codon:yes stop_codon:yes gene_type:complete